MAAVDALIIARMQSDVPVIPMLAEHLISAGGKRLRPLLTVAAARAIGAQGDIAAAPSHLSLAMEQAIAGTKPIPAAPVPTQPQGFLGSVRRSPPPPQRAQFGRRGVK